MALLKVFKNGEWVTVDFSGGTMGDELLINRDIKNAVNIRKFNGDWGNLSIGNYGYDRWLKASATEKGQAIPDGSYVPGKKHTLSYLLGGQRTYETIISPDGGHWLVKVPFIADEMSLRKGVGYTDHTPENQSTRIDKCRYFAETQKVRVSWYNVVYGVYYNYTYEQKLLADKFKPPRIIFLSGKNRVEGHATELLENGFRYIITGYNGRASGDKQFEFIAESEITLGETTS